MHNESQNSPDPHPAPENHTHDDFWALDDGLDKASSIPGAKTPLADYQQLDTDALEEVAAAEIDEVAAIAPATTDYPAASAASPRIEKTAPVDTLLPKDDLTLDDDFFEDDPTDALAEKFTPSSQSIPSPASAQQAADPAAADKLVLELPAEEPEVKAQPKKSISGLEKICLAGFAVVLVSCISYGAMAIKDQIPSKVVLPYTPALPLEGKLAVITEVESYWVDPSVATAVNLNTVHAPAVSIELDSAASKSGALRVFFYDSKDNKVGDTKTVAFTNGQFPNNSNKALIVGSNGFHSQSEFDAYRLDTNEVWSVRIFEAPSRDSRGAEFQELTRIQLTKYSKE